MSLMILPSPRGSRFGLQAWLRVQHGSVPAPDDSVTVWPEATNLVTGLGLMLEL